MKRMPDCNRCDQGDMCNGLMNPKENCSRHLPPDEKWMLAEMALEHPQGIHDTFVSLPFDVNMDFYIK
jgi:hypothetical protein